MLDKQKQMEFAVWAAWVAHSNQKDKAGEPYIFHPLRVMFSLNTHEEKMVALLHDIPEDNQTAWSSKLRLVLVKYGMENAVTSAEEMMKRPGESYNQYIERIGMNLLLTKVKIQDIYDNCNPERLAKLHPATATRLRAKYRPALTYLLYRQEQMENEISS